jgi:hypothetical protein
MNFLIFDPLANVAEQISSNALEASFSCDDHSSNCTVWCGGVSCSGWSCSDYACGQPAQETFD